jgi:hypothetical protein
MKVTLRISQREVEEEMASMCFEEPAVDVTLVSSNPASSRINNNVHPLKNTRTR